MPSLFVRAFVTGGEILFAFPQKFLECFTVSRRKGASAYLAAMKNRLGNVSFSRLSVW